MEELSSLLVGLYAAARQVPMAEFQDTALALVQSLVGFTSAAWGVGRILGDGMRHHSIHLVGDPPDRLMDYEEVKHHDTAAFATENNLGRAFAFHALGLFCEAEFSGICAYARRCEHQCYILASRLDGDSGLLHWIGVYRGDADEKYGEAERRTVELLLPHLDEALSINRALNLARENADGGSAQAIVDRFGVLHHAGPGFLELVQREWPRSDGRDLPSPLTEHLGRALGDRYVGRTIVVRAYSIRDLLLLHARPRMPVDDLTPRQLAVAQSVAGGLPYKEIAQRLGLSTATVRNYAQAVHERLGVHSRHELTAQLKAAGL